MIDDIISDPKFIAALTTVIGIVIEAFIGWTKNSKVAHQSIFLKILGKIGLSFADRWNER